MRELEAKRDSFTIEDEESITTYYKIRQQLRRLSDDMLVIINSNIVKRVVCSVAIGISIVVKNILLLPQFAMNTRQ